MFDSRELLKGVRDRASRATEGPWDADCCSAANMVYARSDHIGFDGTAADAEFIAASRTDVPALVAALEAVLAIKPDEPTCPEDIGYYDGIMAARRAIIEALGVDQ